MENLNLRKLRKAAGITQAELAKAIGITHATLSRYENGTIEPPISQLLNIASVLNTSLQELLGLEYGEGALFSVKLSPELVEALNLPSGVNTLTTSSPEIMQKIVAELSRQSAEKVRLNIAFDSLNSDGQYEAVKRVEELTEIPRYQATTAPQEGTDTTPPPDAPQRPQEDEI